MIREYPSKWDWCNRRTTDAETAAVLDRGSRIGTLIGTVDCANQIRLPNVLIFNELGKRIES